MAYPDVVLADSPTGYWRLDEDAGASANDEVSTNDGTYVNTPSLDVAGLVTNGSAVQMASASSEEITLPFVSAITVTGTLELWFKWTAGGTLMRDHTGTGSSWIIGFDNAGTFAVRCGSTTTLNTSKTTAQVRDGNTHHLVVSKSAGNVTVYLDGVQILAPTSSAGSNAAATPWHVGRNGTNLQYSDMTADEVAYYSTALTAQDVADHYAIGLAPELSAPVYAYANPYEYGGAY